ncbi:hypothetical protein [Shinella sp.]|uniref:hypothetical protein n=1 Tax=Shinella sp. TaxID=1870904 RepID=UPI0028A7C1EA|nr:hypothetical protein [Shinella sp.]
MTAIIARILLRYGAGALVALGLVDADIASQIGADPDLLVLVGAGVALAVEMAYATAKKLGWAT